MSMLSLEQASTIIDTALAHARRAGLKPLCIVVLDAGGHMLALKRDEHARPHVYRAAEPRQRTQKRMLAALIDRVYDGSAMSLVLQALSTRAASKSELEEIRRLINRLEEQSK